jgi:hypothetical protein
VRFSLATESPLLDTLACNLRHNCGYPFLDGQLGKHLVYGNAQLTGPIAASYVTSSELCHEMKHRLAACSLLCRHLRGPTADSAGPPLLIEDRPAGSSMRPGHCQFCEGTTMYFPNTMPCYGLRTLVPSRKTFSLHGLGGKHKLRTRTFRYSLDFAYGEDVRLFPQI